MNDGRVILDKPVRGDAIIAVAASPARRVIATAVLAALGGMLMWLSATAASGALWRLVMVLAGAAVLWGAASLWRSTSGRIVLSAGGLHDGSGRALAPMAAIRSVERGAFAFKPSNGFAVLLTASQGDAWVPGLWWRVGRRVGVGGVVAAAQAKAMAEILTVMLAERDGTQPGGDGSRND